MLHSATTVAGNHEEMRNAGAHLQAAEKAGLRLLNNEKVVVDGMQIIGVHYHEASHPERLNTALGKMAIDREQASVLLVHAPDQLAVAEQAGISLQLSGHTHRGQFFPWTGDEKNVQAICLWSATLRPDAGVHIERYGHVGTATARVCIRKSS
jgi:predicted MPP superfamily phosphohydrolase